MLQINCYLNATVAASKNTFKTVQNQTSNYSSDRKRSMFYGKTCCQFYSLNGYQVFWSHAPEL